MATDGFCGARARRREREAGADGSSSGAHAGYICHLWDADGVRGGAQICMRVTLSL
jgi:hypothetical protein